MTTYSFTLQSRHHAALRAHHLRADGLERASYVICGTAHANRDPWDGEGHVKLLSYDVVLVPDAELTESTWVGVAWPTNSFVQTLKRATLLEEHRKHVVAIVHNHPQAIDWFSEVDDANEPDLWQLAANRNGSGTVLPSLILLPDGTLRGRVWRHRKRCEPMRMIRTVGTDIRLQYQERGQGVAPTAWHRQALAFGHALTEDIHHLRIGIAGTGATGSATAMLLARLGVGQIVVFDHDIVDRTNLSRLHGARQADADAMRPKVEVIKREISELGLGVRIVAIQKWVGDPDCRDALRTCDVIFGCTDDNDGRLFLNRFSYFYLTPVFDLGLGIKVADKTPPEIESLDGRVTVISPGHTCMVCRGVVSARAAHDEAMRRENPSEYERRKDEAYVEGEGDPNPAVVTFTTEVATMAVNEFLHRIQGFRGPEGATAQRTRFFHRMKDIRPGDKPRAGCRFCHSQDWWGQGDMEPFMDRVG